MKFKCYAQYNDSGVEWLGEIPEHWEVKRLKYCVDLVHDKIEGHGTELPYIGLENIESWTGRQILIQEQVSVEGQSNLFKSGDVLFGKLRPYLAKAFRTKESGICTGELLVFRPKETIQSYLFNYLLSKQFIQLVDSSTYGTKMPRAEWKFIGNVMCPVPPIKEQKAVADFLKRETEKIDALIEKKERLIELLKEKRTALITHAVTKGLDPNVPMKDSGVVWLGEIPAKWRLFRLKYLTSQPLSYGANETGDLAEPGLPRYIRITDVCEDGTLRNDTFVSLAEVIAKPFLLKQGDLLLARSGATVGKSFLYNKTWGRSAYAGYLIRARLDNNKTVAKYIWYFTQSETYWDWLKTNFIQATIQNVSAERYSNLSIPLPSLNEQRRIVNFLDKEAEKISVLIDKIREAIGRLKEYRTAFISAAVTGKIDVREETA